MSPAAHEPFRREVAPGIVLKLMEPADAGTLFAMAERDREYLRQWLPWVDGTRSPADILRFITTVVEPQWLDGRGPQCAIWVDGAPAGSIGCHPIDWQNRSCSLGYWIASHYQGRGIITQCTASMLEYLFGELSLHRVVVQCGTGNHRSCAVPQRLGFTREGVLRQAEWVNDRWVDLVLWSILAEEWRQQRGAKPA
jgi:ribosomal-protein-serine acetyltransferase